MRFGITPDGQFGLIVKEYPNGQTQMNIWESEESYFGEVHEVKAEDHPEEAARFIEVIERLKEMGGKASFF